MYECIHKDEIHQYRGYFNCSSICWVDVYKSLDDTDPRFVVVLREHEDNQGSSVSARAEMLASQFLGFLNTTADRVTFILRNYHPIAARMSYDLACFRWIGNQAISATFTYIKSPDVILEDEKEYTHG
jgi:hypothetical protein